MIALMEKNKIIDPTLLKVKFIDRFSQICRVDWDKLEINDSPFLNYDFLSGLETYHCVGSELGWLPHHLCLYSPQKELIAFMPLYVKYNSYGELVFYWSWADAYERLGKAYYPKLVSAIPYTPVTGQRLLVNTTYDYFHVLGIVAEVLKQHCVEMNFSGMHCLFPEVSSCEGFGAKQYASRLACQFHWHNNRYESFEHFLDKFVSRKRKNIKKERQKLKDQGFQFQMLHGDEIEPDLWNLIYDFYRVTFHKKSGIPTFSLEFFKNVAAKLGKQFLVNFAIYQGQYVGCAIFYRDSNTLYGRHWGCFQEFANVHFECCYYQGLEYAISNDLRGFEPGAQGEHKVSRGFLPTQVWSSHWMADREFHAIVKNFTEKEADYMAHYMAELQLTSPFKS